MKLNIESAPQQEASVPEQRKFERRAIERLVVLLQGIEERVAPELQLPHRNSLFRSESIKNLLARHEIQEEDAITVIITKLSQALEDMDRAERTFLPKEEVAEEEFPEVKEAREQVMNIQEEINELYQVNQQILDEQDRLKEELVFLEIFVTEKEEGPMDIQATEMRIAQYKKEIQELPQEKQVGFFARVLQRNDSSDTPASFSVRKEELENKILRTQAGLEERKRKAQEQEERLRVRLQEMQSLIESGPDDQDEELGSWQELVQKIRESAQKIHEKLDEDFENRKKEIEALEAQRDAIENFKKDA